MKKLLIILAIIALAIPAVAADVRVTWNHDGQNVLGFTIYFWETQKPAVVYNKSVADPTARSMIFAVVPDVEYTYEGTAWNQYYESKKSNQLKYTAPGPVYGPPSDSMPDVPDITPPNAPDGYSIESVNVSTTYKPKQ